MIRLPMLFAVTLLALPGCTTAPAGPSAVVERSILASSIPAAGATVAAPVEQLVLTFSPPARLIEVTVSGPDGTMPIMVTAVGEVGRYVLPLSGLEPGGYRVDWRASVGGAAHSGSFAFTVR